ncbi:Comm domain-containing protein 3, partial [Globisporangium splendens]
MAGGVLAFAGELEELPRDTLVLLVALPRTLVESIVQCAESELVRGHVVAKAKAPATASEPQIPQLVPAWQALGHELPALQSVYAVVCSLVVTFAKENYFGAVSQRQALQEFGLDDPDFVAFFLPILVQASQKVRVVLEQASFDFAHVVDVNWRLDYVLRSSMAGSIHEPLYFVQIKLQTPAGKTENLEFTCSVEELRDLVYRIQEAVNEVEKIASGLASTSSISNSTASTTR